jgi:hypothetical protein
MVATGARIPLVNEPVASTHAGIDTVDAGVASTCARIPLVDEPVAPSHA